MPAWMVEKFPNLVNTLEGMRSKGYKSGGGVGFQAGGQVSAMGMNLSNMKGWLDGIKESLSNITRVVAGAFKQLAKVLQQVLNVVGEALGLGKLGDKIQELIAGFNNLLSGQNKQSQEQKDVIKGVNIFSTSLAKLNSKVKDFDKSFFEKLKAKAKQLWQGTKKTIKNLPGEIGGQLKSAVGQNSVVQSGMQGFKSGGFAGAIAGIVSKSEQFGKIMKIINPLMQTVANSLGMLLQPIIPLVNIISQTLGPIMKALGNILKAVLMPVFKALFPVVKYLGIILTTVTLGIMKVYNFFARAAEKLINGIINLVNKIPGVDFGKVSLTVDTSGIENSLEQLKNSSFESASAIEEEKKEREKLNETIRNSVEGFKVALTRFNVSDPRVPSAAVGGTVQSSGIAKVHSGEVIMNEGQQAAAGGTTVNVNIENAYGQEDFERKVDEAVQKADRRRKISSNGLART